MSDTSPHHHVYGQQPNVTPGSHLGGMTDSAGTTRSYSGEPMGGAPETPVHGHHQHNAPHSAPPLGASSSKGKNGATGPAEGKTKPHICPICGRGFTTGGHLQRHGRIHTGVKAFKCPFPGCETKTSRQDNLQQHYRTHLSPTLRRGSGTAARQAIAAAMMAAGLKSSSTRQPRKSKGGAAGAVGTPSSTSSASAAQHASPYQTPTSQGSAPYGGYMYDPQQHGGYPGYPLPPPGVGMPQSASAQSSRVPSPVNGHSAMQMPGHHQPFYSNFSPSPYQPYGAQYQQPPPYRYGGAPGSMASPYGAPHPHHGLYSPGIAAEHGNAGGSGGGGGGGHMYSPLQTGFTQHSRESSYGGAGVLTPGSYATQAPMGGPGGNAHPPRAQTSTPLSQAYEDTERYRRSGAGVDPSSARPPSPRRRLTPPNSGDILASGNGNAMPGMGGYGGAYGGGPGGAAPPHHMGYAYGAPGASGQPGMQGMGGHMKDEPGMMGHHRGSISSEGSGGKATSNFNR